ncbi:MAPEG family protein [Sphingomonas sp. DT-204]|uniref:MAPEG family protein n=1 Tax=Sphingomonas sp. DT-204 TaxID=3396166 RepID=UPI003F1C5FEB
MPGRSRSLQVPVAAGMAAATAVTVGAFWIALTHMPAIDPAPVEAIRTALRWLVLSGACLLAGIALTAAHRFSSPEAIDGGSPAGDDRLTRLLRYNRNTAEQLLLVAVAWPALAATHPPAAVALIPPLAGLFVAGRLAFGLGYRSPPVRAMGFGLCFYPTVALFGWLIAALT